MLEKIGKYRSAIMGGAILWIMVYHSGISFSFLPLLSEAVNNFCSNGFGGTDIFFFVSGFGLYQSLLQNPDQLEFYKRRLRRILPAYMPMLIMWCFVNLPGIPVRSWLRIIMGNLMGISFWIGQEPAFSWYMLALYSFYFIAPFFFNMIRTCKNAGWALAITFVFDVCFYGNYVMIAITRFTIFVIGMEMGRWAKEGKEVNKIVEVIAYSLGFLSYELLLFWSATCSNIQLWNGGLFWYPFIFIAPAITFLLCRLFSLIEKYMPHVFWLFEAIGKCSLEIYLIHARSWKYIHVSSNWIWLLVYGATLFLGILYHVIIKLLSPIAVARIKTFKKKIMYEGLRKNIWKWQK